MRRDDETLLEYIIRIAKEGGEDLGEGLQQLGVNRLKKARPDVAERQGLLEPQYDETMVMEESSPFPDRSPAFMPEDITSLMSTQEPTPDRASLEAMIAQPRAADPRALRETINRGVPGMTTNPTTGRTPIEDDLLMSWSGSGQAPLEPSGLMQQDLEQTRAKEQAQTLDPQVASSPVTARMPTADIAAASPVDFPGTQVGPMSNLERARIRDVLPDTAATEPSLREAVQARSNPLLNQVGGALQQASEESLKSPTSIEDYLKRVVGQTGKGFGHFQPGRLATSGFGGELGKWLYKLAGKPDLNIKDLTTKGVDLAPIIAEAKEKITGEKAPEDTGWIKSLLVEEVVEAPGVEKDPASKNPTVDQSIAQAKKFTGSKKGTTEKPDKPTYFGHGSKEDFLRSAGILGGDKESKDFAGRMDKIDSEAGMFEIIAMLGGAGNSRAGKNFRDKSYQRLRTEMQMDDREWNRQFKIMAHPWDTWYWYDPEAGIKPISRPRGMGMGEGWQQQPISRDKGTTYTRNYNEILEMWDGTPRSEALMKIRFINEQIPSGMFLEADGQDGLFNNFMDVAFPLPNGGKRWTPLEIQQAKLAISKGSKGDIEKILKRKSYVPPELRAAIKELFPELFPEQ